MSFIEKEQELREIEKVKDNYIREANGIKESLRKATYQIKKTALRIVTIAAAVSIILSSTSFAGTHTVYDWEQYKAAIVKDILKQDSNIIINYERNDVYEAQGDLSARVKSLYYEAVSEISGTLEENNVRSISMKTAGIVINNVDYKLTTGTYGLTYKNSYDDLEQAQYIIDSFLNKNVTSNMSDYEKVREVYDFIIDEYSCGYSNSGDQAQDELDERNILLGLQGNPVVCEGYSMLFSKMISSLGYNNMIIRGKIDGVGHSWNLIELDNKWYHVDATWGDSDSEENLEKYFLTSDDVIEDRDQPVNTRNWDRNNYPTAREVYSGAVNNQAKTATNAVELAESEQTQDAIDYAFDLISDLEDES